MKAIIPVAGAGKRLRPLTYTQPKPLIPIAGKPIIGFIIDELLEAGIDDFIFVIGYMGEKVREYLEENYPNINKEYVVQETRQGLGHAIYLTKDLMAKGEEVFIALGDTVFEIDLQRMIKSQSSIVAIKKVNDPREFGVVEIGNDGVVTKAIEKPSIPRSNQAIVGLYKISDTALLMDCLEEIIQSGEKSLGEYQLTDAIMLMIERGEKFTTLKTEQWFDCGRKEILLDTNKLLLRKSSKLKMPEGKFEDTIIIDPVFIGDGCVIKSSIIGPNVTIGNNCHLDEVIVKNTIIGDYSNLDEVVLRDSVIGNDTAIKGIQQSLNLGDNTQIDFSI